ncbi:zinc dependent phospholipase C family protein [Anaeromusa acidaminophila]|uniref:zinc dependent phospholipase C family protein n=1 Tax=Anaeromusa acidaminophila TaxID=81464 RepID=UPI00036B96F0|nr:zinc dependent phospholipase C family protein [Anaeromusa acidaminophila]
MQRIFAWARWPIWALARLLLLTASPFQLLVDRGPVTHQLMIAEGLRRMGKTLNASLLIATEKELLAGVAWADKGWKNITHYYHPHKKKGLLMFPSAFLYYKEYLTKAKRLAQRGKWGKAAFYLGAAAHLLQDMCVPHHATGNVFFGHREFETWAAPKAAKLVRQATEIRLPADEEELFQRVVEESAALFELVKDETEAGYTQAATLLLPLAAEATGKLFVAFAASLQTSEANQPLRLAK